MEDASGDGAPARERRSAVRAREDLRAMFVVHPHYSDVRRARVRNLSVGGACILGIGELAVGAELSVGFFLADEPDPLVAIARVVWSRPEPGGHAAGLAFAEGATAQRLAMLRLSVYLEARLAAATGPG
jgi:hypothetical protein